MAAQALTWIRQVWILSVAWPAQHLTMAGESVGGAAELRSAHTNAKSSAARVAILTPTMTMKLPLPRVIVVLPDE